MLTLLRSKLQIKLISIFLLLVILPLSLIAIISLNLLSTNLQDELYESLSSELLLIQHMIEDYARDIGERAQIIAQLPSVAENLLSMDSMNLNQILSIYQRNVDRGNSLMNVLGIYDKDINIINLAGRAHDRTGFDKIPPLIQEALATQETIYQVYPSHLGLIIIGASPVLPRGEREAIGVIFAITSLDSWFFDSFKEITSSDITLLGASEVLATTFFDEEGRRLRDFSFQEGLLDEVLKEQELHTTLLEIDEEIYSLGLIPYNEVGEGTILMAGSSYQPILAAERAIKGRIFTIGGFSIIGSILLALLFSLLLTKPITRLAEMSKRIADGFLPKREIRVRSKDQVGRMAESFNTMVGSLRTLITQVKDSSQQVESTAQSLSSSAQESSAASEEVSTHIEETSASIEEFVASIEEVAHGAQELSQSSVTSKEWAKKGERRVQVLESKIHEIGKIVEESSQSIGLLKKQMREINKMIELIQEIMEQTNLLALNAAIESARAGEYGLGFAVVADKIKALADESSLAADQVTEIIGQIQKDTENVANSMELEEKEVREVISLAKKARGDLEKMEEAISKTDSISQTIKTSTEQQNRGSQEMTTAVDRIATIAEEEAITANNLSTDVEALVSMAKELSRSIENFTIEED